MNAARLPAVRRIPPILRRVRPDVILFDSWSGKLADSPKAISDELRRRDAPFRQVWVLNDPAKAPDACEVVRPGSLAHLEYLGRAGHIVSNNTQRGHFRKKRATTYLQTWHGTPLKRIAFDVEGPWFAGSERYLVDLRREVATWDFLLSPNRFSTEVFRHAFRYEGRILETGYPRNDLLSCAERDSIRSSVRRELEVPDGARVVLYAPTWRDDSSFSTELDIGSAADALGDQFVLLLRAHKQVADTVSMGRHPRVRNVSDRDDIGELLLAADVLVTDYSSVMFDFAVTGKPMLFFTYDLARYRDELRGFYFDFVSEAPGPLIETQADLVEALREVDEVRARFAGAYDRFRERFCHLDDGHAAERVVDEVFFGSP